MPGLLRDLSARAHTLSARSKVSWQTPIHTDRPALIDPAGVISHRQLAAEVTEQARRLDASRHGRRLIQLPMVSTRAAVISYLSVLAAGHVALVTGPDATEIESRYQPDGWLSPTGEVTLADQAQHLLHPELALLLSTSGSTGSPKLVRLSTANLVSNADAIIAALGLTAQDKTATTLPLTYCFGLSVLHSHLRAGAGVVLDPTPVTDPGSTIRLAGHQISTLAVTPHLLEALSLQGALTGGLPRLRLISQAGGALPARRVAEIAALGRRHGYGLAVMYGQTEATARMSVLPPELAESYPESVGWPVAGSEFRVDQATVGSEFRVDQATVGSEFRVDQATDSGSRAAGPSPIGELVFSGPGVMLGYAQHPDDLALPRTTTELPTGDLGWIDADGLIRVTGRKSGFVKIMGIRVDLGRIERALADRQISACVSGDDTAIRVCAATRPPGPPILRSQLAATGPTGDAPSAGETPMAECTPSIGDAGASECTGAGIRQLVAGLARVGIGSVQVRLVPQLPLLANGKLDRRAAATGFPSPRPEAAYAAAGQPLDQVVAALGPLLGRTDLDPDRSFAELGGDSFTHVQAATRLAQLVAADRRHQPRRSWLTSGRLPVDWHHRPLHQLAELLPSRPELAVRPDCSARSDCPVRSDYPAQPAGPDQSAATVQSPAADPSVEPAAGTPGAGTRKPGRTRRTTGQSADLLRPIQIETSAVLRAAAVIMICGSHVGLFSLAGGAHILLAVAGFHYARYIATVPGNAERWRRTGRAIIGIGLPAIAVAVGMKVLLADDGGWPRALLVNSFLQPDQGSIYWFVESLLAALIAVTALLSVPRLQALALLDLWRFTIALGCLALIPRYLVVGLVEGPVRGLPWTVAWLFVFGMALATAATRRQQLLTVAIAVAATLGFFPNTERNLMIAFGLIVLGLVLTVPLPRLFAKPIEVLSAASLYVYLIQFPVFRLSDFPAVEFVSALVVGLLFWMIAHPLVRRCQSIIALASVTPIDRRSTNRLRRQRSGLRLNSPDGLRPGREGIFS